METFKPTDDEVFEKQYRIIHMYHHSSDAGLGTPWNAVKVLNFGIFATLRTLQRSQVTRIN